jgi:hypothetical protein
MHQWRKELTRKMAAMSEEEEDSQKDLQEDHRAGDRKVNNRVFDWAMGNE